MTLQTSGEISLGGSTAGRSVNLTLGRSATASININDSAVRGLAGRSAGAVSFSDFYGKTLSYSIVPNVTSVNEGSSVTFTITTSGVLSGTVLYWTTNGLSGIVNASDFTDSAVSGSFTINNNTATITRTLRNDVTTEGTESFRLEIRTGSTSGTIVATSSIVTINDTSINPTYSITPNITSVNEGSSVTFTVTTTGVANGTTLFWTTESIIGTVNASDFTDAVTTGSFTINNNTATITRTLRNDSLTEGTESFRLRVHTGSTSGTVVATSTGVGINDTSLTPPGQITFQGDQYGYGTFTTSSWVVPEGVFSVSVVCIGGGGGGRSFTSSVVAGGGGGGALAWANNISVTPRQVITIEAGHGGQGLQTTNTNANKSGDGGRSSFSATAGTVIAAGGRGAYGTNTNTVGGFGGGHFGGTISGGGGYGGDGGRQNTQGLGGGGGAGGYTNLGLSNTYASGGRGASWGSGSLVDSTAGFTGGAGGGGGGKRWIVTGSRAGNGGGTGVLGQGANGAAGTTNLISDASTAGSGGAGSGGSGNLYGGGGGGGFNLSNVSLINGGWGAVRIIWPGNLRQFPSTRTADE
jgi:hypothetical protein